MQNYVTSQLLILLLIFLKISAGVMDSTSVDGCNVSFYNEEGPGVN